MRDDLHLNLVHQALRLQSARPARHRWLINSAHIGVYSSLIQSYNFAFAANVSTSSCPPQELARNARIYGFVEKIMKGVLRFTRADNIA